MTSTAEPLTNWLELPSDIILNILQRVGVVDIFENVEKVCTRWHKICKHPVMWRVISMTGTLCGSEKRRHRKICKLAVDRSEGQLVDLTIEDFGNGELLEYIANRSSQLRRLEFAFCYSLTSESCNQSLKKFPLLEELNLYSTSISKEAIETAGRYCPMLKTLKVNERGYYSRFSFDEHGDEFLKTGNELAKAIGENLFNLRHLQLIGCGMSNEGLEAILDGCCLLEKIDLCLCWNLKLKEILGKIRSKLIKPPWDSLEGCPYLYEYTKPGEVCDEHFAVCGENCKFRLKLASKVSLFLAEGFEDLQRRHCEAVADG